MRLRDIFKEQEQPATITLLTYYNEDGKEVVQPIEDFPLSVYNREGFDRWIRNWFSKNFPGKMLIRYAVQGNRDSQGNPVGRTPDTEVPPVLTSRDNEEVPPVEQKPEEQPLPTPDTTDEPKETPPAEQEPEETPPEETPPAEQEPEPELDGMDVEIISSNELAAMQYNAELSRRDQNDDGIDDETGEVQPLVYRDGTLRNPDNPEEVIGTVPGYEEPKAGGGQDGAEGDAGIEGEEGAVTGAQRAEIPSIVEELYRSLNGLGTNETRLLYALKRIESTSHLNAVLQMYRQTYNQSLPQDIINDLKFQGGNTKKVIEEINKVMMPLGAQLVGSQWFNLRWVTFNPSEWGDLEQLYEYPITEYIAAREKYYQNLTREEEILYPDGGSDMRTDLSDREQAELDSSKAEREELLNKYGRGILRGNISVEFLPGEQA